MSSMLGYQAGEQCSSQQGVPAAMSRESGTVPCGSMPVWPKAPEQHTPRHSPHLALLMQVLCLTVQQATPLHSSLLGRMCLRVPAGIRQAPTCRSCMG